MRTIRRLILFCALPPLFGQVTLGTGSAGGLVRDASGALVAGAKITLTEESKRLTREAETDAQGSFLFPSVAAGVYSVEVRKPGFRAYRVQQLQIEVGEQAFITAALTVGDVRTEINVPAPSEVELDAGSMMIGSVVDSGRVQQLPLNGRNFLQLSLLSADTKDLSPANDLFTTYVGPPARGVILPGTLPYSVEYSVDGIYVAGSRGGELAVGPSVAAIEQFKVQQTFLTPEQGVNPAVVNVVTKSGGNQFHGEAFEFLRNHNLDARSFFATAPEDLKRNQFGVAAGGPLSRNHVWFHGFYEGLREITAFSSAAYTPTTAMFGGDFRATGRVIYDPASYSAASLIREPFPESIIPTNRINPVARNLLAYYAPGTSLASLPSNFSGNPRNTLDDDQGGLRVDAAVTPRQQLFGRILVERSPADRPGLFPYSGLLYLNNSELAMLQHTWSRGPHAVNVLRIGFLRTTVVGGNEAQNGGPVLSSIGIANTFETRGISSINLQGYSSFGRSNGSLGSRDNSWQVSEDFAWLKGRHSFDFGAQMDYRRSWQLAGNVLALGSLTFQPTFTAQLAATPQGQLSPVANTGDSFADFLLGAPVTGLMAGLPAVPVRGTRVTPFFQDSWRITETLTLNYGVSWFLEVPPTPQSWARNDVHGFDTRTGLLTYAALGQIDPQIIATDWKNLSPRAGLAWKPAFLKSTVFRAGAGIYYSEMPWVFTLYSLLGGSPISASQTFTNSPTSPLPQYILGSNIFPPPPPGAITADYARNLPTGSSVDVVAPGYRAAYNSSWTAGLQHSFDAEDSGELFYTGSSSHRLPNIGDLSQCRPTAGLFCDPATRPWPRYGLVLQTNSDGNSSYEGITAKYRRRVEKGLDIGVEYSLAKVLSDSWQSAASGVYSQITTCRSCAKGPATFDVRNRAVGSMVWELPFGRGRTYGAGMSRALDLAAGGWALTGIVTFQNGQPIAFSGPNTTGSQYVNHLPNRICDGRSSQLSNNIRSNGFLWFDPSCFPVPPVGYFGNSGRTVIYAPGIDNWDLAAVKSFPLVGESTRLQVRAEAFNTWNHAQFGQPNGNAGAGATFGRISSAQRPRLLQLAVKVLW